MSDPTQAPAAQGVNHPAVRSVLDTLKQAFDVAISGTEASVPQLEQTAQSLLVSFVAPQFHVPAPIVESITNGTAVASVVDPLAIAGLEWVRARIDALL